MILRIRTAVRWFLVGVPIVRSDSGGTFVISLDFELHWGLHACDLAACSERLLGACVVVPRMLDLFAIYDIAATWATVGFLFFGDKEELLCYLPKELPQYDSPALSSYTLMDRLGPNEREDPFHFGLSLITKINEAPRQEIASHTFSHYYCLEQGQRATAFAADLAAAQRAAQRLGINLKSLVFPRNQANPAYLSICGAEGFKVIRGNSSSWLYSPVDHRGNDPARRVGRLADAYVPVTGTQSVRPNEPEAGIIDIPASAFLRPVRKSMNALEPLRLRRILHSMSAAAQSGSIYHLWWHPHNFGRDTEANLHFLGRILDHYRELADNQGMRSATMAEAVA